MLLQIWPPGLPVAFTAHGLHFREWRPDDAAQMVRLYDTEQMNRWTPLPSPFTYDVALDYVAQAHAARDGGTLQLAVLLAPDAEAVAEVIVFPTADAETVELAYAVGAAYQGQGIATRSVQAAAGLARQGGMRRVVLTIAEGNDASASVARAAGFARTEAPVRERRRKGFVLQMATWALEL